MDNCSKTCAETQTSTSRLLVRTENVVNQLKKMPDGWGGDTSKKPSPKALRKAKKLLTIIEQGYMPWPSIMVEAVGSLILSWQSATRDILITVDIDGDVQFMTSLKVIDKNTGEIRDRMDSEGHIHDMKTLDSLVVWYCTDKSNLA